MLKIYFFTIAFFLILLFPISLAALTTTGTFSIYRPNGVLAGSSAVSCTVSGNAATCDYSFSECAITGWYTGHVVFSHGGTNSDDTPLDPTTQTERYPTSGEQNLYECDATPPSVSVSGAPASWQNTDATASVNCSDTGSGCNATTYRLKTYSSNPGSCSNNYADYTLSSPSTISSHVWVCGAAKDNAGNAGFSSPAEFKVDKIAPTGTLSGVPAIWQNTDASITLTCSDTGDSGCDSNNDYYYLSSSSSCPAFSTFTYTAYTGAVTVNSHKWFCYSVADNAGNRFTTTSGTEIKVDKDAPSITISASPLPPCTLDPLQQWIDCSATVSVNCVDEGSGCNASILGYKIYSASPGSCPLTKSIYTSGNSVTITNLSWVCGYGEDLVGNVGVTSPAAVEIKVNKTFTITAIDAKLYDADHVPMPNTEVKMYLCYGDVEYCNQDAQYIAMTSAMSNESGYFSATLSAVLERGLQYKIGIVTEKGYAESLIMP